MKLCKDCEKRAKENPNKDVFCRQCKQALMAELLNNEEKIGL